MVDATTELDALEFGAHADGREAYSIVASTTSADPGWHSALMLAVGSPIQGIVTRVLKTLSLPMPLLYRTCPVAWLAPATIWRVVALVGHLPSTLIWLPGAMTRFGHEAEALHTPVTSVVARTT